MDSSHVAAPRRPTEEDIAELERIFRIICAAHPLSVGKKASAKDRESMPIKRSGLTYGEINFEPFARTILKIRDTYAGLPQSGGRFYDIGAGSGKPAIAAALLHSWETCRGVEVLESLHAVSLDLLAVWERPESRALLPPWATAKLEFICADATEYAWEDADLWFANSTCFDEELMAKLAVVANRMRVGTFGVTFTKALPSALWQVLESNIYDMSWGHATVFIQRKIA